MKIIKFNKFNENVNTDITYELYDVFYECFYNSYDEDYEELLEYIDDDIMDKETWIAEIDHSMGQDDKYDVGRLMMKKMYNGDIDIFTHLVNRLDEKNTDSKIINSLKMAFNI